MIHVPPAHTALTRHPTAARRARIWTRATLCAWHISGQVVEDIELVVSELVSNSLLHAHGPIRARLCLVPDRIRIEVSDSGPASGTDLRPDRHVHGRGLLITSTVATQCGWDRTGGQAVAWATVPLVAATAA